MASNLYFALGTKESLADKFGRSSSRDRLYMGVQPRDIICLRASVGGGPRVEGHSFT